MKRVSLLFIFTMASILSVAFAAQSTSNTSDQEMSANNPGGKANVVKGNYKLPGYQPQPTILTGKNSPTNPAFYNNNNNWRESLYSGDQAQMVMMTISPETNKESNDVPDEIHDFDQFIYILSGNAKVSFKEGAAQDVPAGSWILVPAYTSHYIKNASTTQPLKILSVYSKWDTKQPTMAFKTRAEEDKYDAQHDHK
ncbi:MAG: cupin domain-containing protein [Pseudomonadota bacterium]